MAETLDSLQIEITSNATKASKTIEKLTASLYGLQGAVSGANISGLKNISDSLKEISGIKAGSISGLAKQISQLGNMDTQKISQMKLSLKEFGKSVTQLNGVSVGGQISQMSELARSISRLGNASASTAISNMPKFASGLKQMMGTLSTAPKVSQNLIDMTKALGDFARTGSSGVKAANSLGSSVKAMSTKFLSAPKAMKQFNASLKSSVASINRIKDGILSAIGVVGGFAAVIAGIKKSIDVRSDVIEAQNVIDVTFGQYKNMVEDMAKTSIKDFGISELAVKNTAGRYQAMGMAAGIARKEMAKMSTTLTGLSADMASFYNQNQEDVAKSLQSVFTGETEPLRKYGIDLTNATLKEWAMKQGLDANIQSMSQAEKIMLRYNYVLDNSAAAQGDFARTSGTWANQIKILKEQLTQLASVLGTAFINALKPLVTSLNNALSSIIQFAVKVVNALGAIFGWKAVISNTGIADDFSDAASGADDIADSTGKAAGNSKKLKDNMSKAIRSFDELKTISMPDASTSGSSGGGAGGGGITDDKAFEIVETENPYKSSIKDLYGLGKEISKALMNEMNSIDWDSIYAKASGFGKGLAQFLNGLFAADKDGNTVFGAMGKTIAGALNTLIYSIFSFSKEFKWADFGKAIKDGIQSFINTADLATAGYTVGNLVKGISTAVYEAVKDKNTWKDLGKKIAEGINGFLKSMGTTDPSTGKNGWQISAKAFSGIGDAVLTAITEALEQTNWEDLGTGIAQFLSEIDYGQLLADAIKASVSLINAAQAFADGLLEGFDPKAIATSIADGMSQINQEDLTKIVDTVGRSLPENPIKKYLDISQTVEAITGVKLSFEELKKIDFSKWWNESVKPYFKKDTWVEFGNNIKNSIVSGTKNMIKEWSKSISIWWKTNVSPWFTKKKWENISLGIKGGISSTWNSFKNWWRDTAIANWMLELENKFSTENIKSKIGSIKSAFSEKWIEMKKWWVLARDNWMSGFKSSFSELNIKGKIGSIKAAFRARWLEFTKWWNGIKLSFPKIKIPHFKIGSNTTSIFGEEFKYPKVEVEYYAAGGFPSSGSLFWAGENGVPEILGNVGGKTAVAGGKEITGIKDAINSTSDQEISLLRRQNELLQAILQKETGITKKEIGKAARDYAREQHYKTGENVFLF